MYHIKIIISWHECVCNIVLFSLPHYLHLSLSLFAFHSHSHTFLFISVNQLFHVLNDCSFVWPNALDGSIYMIIYVILKKEIRLKCTNFSDICVVVWPVQWAHTNKQWKRQVQLTRWLYKLKRTFHSCTETHLLTRPSPYRAMSGCDFTRLCWSKFFPGHNKIRCVNHCDRSYEFCEKKKLY